MDTPAGLSRRRLLTSLGLVGTGLLAGCNQNNSPTATEPTQQSETTTEPPPPTNTVVFTDTSTPSKTTSTAGPTRSTAGPRVFDGGDLDAFTDALHALDETGGGTLSIETGTYRFDAETPPTEGKHPFADYRGFENITIEGNGASIVFTNPLRGGFWFTGGSDITVCNLTLDYDPVPFTQGTIRETAADGRTVTLELDEDFPPLSHEMFERTDEMYATVHRPDGAFVRGVQKDGPWDKHFADITRLDGRQYELTLTESTPPTGLREGRKLTVLARNNETALSFYKVTRPTVRNVTIHATNGAAFSAGVCELPVFEQCTIAPPDGSTRHLGADADGIRVINCFSDVTIEECRHESLGDDSIVVQRTLTSVTDIVDEHTVEVDNVHPFVAKAGDVLEVMAPTGIVKGALPPIASITDRFPTRGDRGKPETITFEEAVGDTVAEGDFLGNRATGSRNFAVRNNVLRNHRANLIRIAASEGIVEDNVLEGCSINPIELECDTGGAFSPKGWVTNVTVRNNRIRRAGLNYFAGPQPAGIRVHHKPPRKVDATGRPNGDITIVENDIAETASIGVKIEAADGVRVDGNTLQDLNQMGYSNGGYGFVIENSGNVALTENEVTGSATALTAFGRRTKSDDITQSGNRFLLDGDAVPAELLQWVPVTFAFNRTVRPEGSNRALAFACYKLWLLDDSGDIVQEVDVGRNEEGMVVGQGVFGKEQSENGSWRWLGTEQAVSVFRFTAADLDAAATLKLQGYPIDDEISAVVSVDGQRTDEVSFGPVQHQTYSISLSPS